ncbi:MAG: peptidase, partial [Alistipes sp.]
EFATKGGRKVYNSGGIMPDLRTEPEYSSRFAMTLYVMGFLDDFGDRYMQAHPTQRVDNHTFAITDADYADFGAFMKDKKVEYESDTRRALKALRKATETDRYTQVTAQIDALEKGLKDDTATNLRTYRKEITELIESDIVLRHNYVAGVIERNVTGRDKDVGEALKILNNPQEYTRIVTEQDTQKK